MDKEQIIKLGIKMLKEKIVSLKEAVLKMEKQRQEAPSAMQSWSDTSRFQTGVAIENMDKERSRLEEHLDFLKSFKIDKKTEITLGSLAEVKDLEKNKAEIYFVSLFADLELKDGGRVIKFISKDSPLIKQLLSKKAGDKASLQIGRSTRELEILSVV